MRRFRDRAWSLWLTGAVVPVIEPVAGLLVLLGFRTRPALLSLGAVLRPRDLRSLTEEAALRVPHPRDTGRVRLKSRLRPGLF
jgi:hypothetical protein